MYMKLIMVLNDTCPKKARKMKIKANTWFTKDHKKLAKKVKTYLGESWAYYKKIAKKYKALCKKKQGVIVEKIQGDKTDSK